MSANNNPVDKLDAGPAIYQIAFATVIAEVPADAITNAELLIGNSRGIRISVIIRTANAAPTEITISSRLLIFLQTAKLYGHKYSAPISELAVAPAKCSLHRQHALYVVDWLIIAEVSSRPTLLQT